MRMDAHVNPVERMLRIAAVLALLVMPATSAIAQETPTEVPTEGVLEGAKKQIAAQIAKAAAASPGAMPNSSSTGIPEKLPDVSSRDNFGAAMQIIILLTVL